MNRFITSKQHYKMYKKGRFWVFAGITVATFTLNPLISRADTETTTAANRSYDHCWGILIIQLTGFKDYYD
ncbi:KxYKxGKxW signal peptide domain-containing protein [Lactiplantibacillus plantarum]|uniref:KxYKxGKxW signal peptide domain-containing protein n=1 Tax=Lactiplantibacillus plantarum TaxID=1590 RepID=UPI0038541DD1|nr:N-acetylmuramoyl-L-alanine amidase [Lactiplantibacillus plantarum]MCG0743826.1 N-acetylmuramoyl-L-alanine amidase [Lactiplantibacillus plantarum]MCG0884739.1 N-acetylmuramoyl-L-alanine amidase [Lactiplantibacillus plantarum]